MNRRTVVLLGRAVVLVCAAVLSFSALYDLAVLCGFYSWQAVLFPVMVDAGVAIALATAARGLAYSLLASTVIGNAVAHILVAYGLRPHWSIVVIVAGLAPTVLAAVWRLDAAAVAAVQSDEIQDKAPAPEAAPEPPTVDEYVAPLEAPAQSVQVQPAQLADVQSPLAGEVQASDVQEFEPSCPVIQLPDLDTPSDVQDRVRELVAAGAGRAKVRKELDLNEYQAKQLIARVKSSTNGKAVV